MSNEGGKHFSVCPVEATGVQQVRLPSYVHNFAGYVCRAHVSLTNRVEITHEMYLLYTFSQTNCPFNEGLPPPYSPYLLPSSKPTKHI